MTVLRLLLAGVVAACSLSSANAAFQTFSYAGAPVSIPDASAAGTNLDIVIPTGAQLSMLQFQSLTVNMSTGTANTATGAHSWVGDLFITLTHLESGASMHVMRRPGVNTGSGVGDSTNFGGTYTFSNLLTLTNPLQPRVIDNAAPAGTGVNVTNGVYLPTTNSLVGGGGPLFTGETATNFNTTFDGIGSMGGTWRLNISDNAGGDIGQIVGWSFTADAVSTPAPAAVWMGLAGAGALGLLRRRITRTA